MDGKIEYEGIFRPDTGQAMIPQSSLKILSEETSQHTNLWIALNEYHLAPLIFLQNGTVLIPNDAYREGLSKLEHFRQVRGK